MKGVLQKHIEQVKENRKKRNRLVTLFCVLSLFVAVGVFWQLRIVGITMTDEACCGKVEHQHTQACMEKTLICGKEEGEMDGAQLICDISEHIHGSACYQTQRVLVCDVPGHQHTDACYEEQQVLLCTQQEHTHTADCYANAVPHVHTADCYKTTYVCGLEEHQHTRLCYRDPRADVESKEDWEQTLPEKLSENWADALVSIAKSQLGYEESTRNFELAEDGVTEKGYSRYGAWYGNPYGDWNTMFASFCLHYAHIPEEYIPQNSGAFALQSMVRAKAVPLNAEPTLQAGDIVFFADDPQSKEVSHSGIVTAVKGEDITVIMGDMDHTVSEVTRKAADVKGTISTASIYTAAAIEQRQAQQEQLNALLTQFDEEGCALSVLIDDSIAGEVNSAMVQKKTRMDEIYGQALPLYLALNTGKGEVDFQTALNAECQTAWLAYCEVRERVDVQTLKEQLEQFDQKGAELSALLVEEPKDMQQIKDLKTEIDILYQELAKQYQKVNPDKHQTDFESMMYAEHSEAMTALEEAAALLEKPSFTDPVAGELNTRLPAYTDENLTVQVHLKGELSFPVQEDTAANMENDAGATKSEAPAKSPWDEIEVQVSMLEQGTEEYETLYTAVGQVMEDGENPESLKALILIPAMCGWKGNTNSICGMCMAKSLNLTVSIR